MEWNVRMKVFELIPEAQFRTETLPHLGPGKGEGERVRPSVALKFFQNGFYSIEDSKERYSGKHLDYHEIVTNKD